MFRHNGGDCRSALVPNCSINGWRGIRSAPLRALYAERDSENGWSMRQFETVNGDRRYG